MTDEPAPEQTESPVAGLHGPMPALVVRGLARRYEGRVAVDDLSFEVRAGEVLGLLGPNGAGKTTTLRSIAGVLPLQRGRVWIGGHDLTQEELEAKRRLAWVPDDPAPFEALTIEEHLEFTARLYRVADGQGAGAPEDLGWRARVEGLLARFELADRRTALGSELSRGMRQKLAFCQAWLVAPSVVLLDEPLAGLDPRGIRSAKAAIRELAESGTAVILSSHQLELVEALAHRLLILDRGRKVFDGTLAEARARVLPGSSLEDLFLELTGDGAPARDAL
ncbi:MAG: ABC transporter ATP-binding protein [Planctomycetota bacterium]